MSLTEMFTQFVDTPEVARRAVFEAAMIKRLESGQGYKMSEMMFDLFECQRRLDNAEDEIDRMDVRIDALVAKISKKKTPKMPAEPEDEFDD
jgi:hypothetical protein